MKIAVAGKGGSGKTSIAGTLARLLARQGVDQLVAIDGDSNPNLAITLGIAREQAKRIAPLPRTILTRVPAEDGKTRAVLAEPASLVVERFGLPAPDGVTLLLMGSVDHAGAG